MENIRRFQQQQQAREQPQPTTPQQQQTFKLPEAANWARHASQNNEQNQPLNFAEIQKQEQEQERRARETALAAQNLVIATLLSFISHSASFPSFQTKSEALNIPHSSSSNKQSSWARTLFAGNASGFNNQSSEQESNDNSVPESPGTSYNQQATNAVLSLLNIHVCCAVIFACFYFLIHGKANDILEN